MSQPDGKLGDDEGSAVERTVVDAGVLSLLRGQGVAPPPADTAATTGSLSIDELGDAFPQAGIDDAATPTTPLDSSTARSISALGDAFPAHDTDPQAMSSDDDPREAAAPPLRSGPREPASSGQTSGKAAAPVEALVAAIAESARTAASSGASATESVSLSSAIEDAWAEIDRDQSWRTMTAGQAGTDARRSSGGLGIGRQRTNVLRAGAASRDEPPALLACIAGADQGVELALGSRPSRVGRSPFCDLVLTDRSVSREHARLYRREDHYFVQDMGSGNGTFVNGLRVTEQCLASGDEVVFGRARFRFCEIGDVFKRAGAPASAARRRVRGQPRSLLWYGLVSVFILLSALIVVLAIVHGRRQDSVDGPDLARYVAAGRAALEARQWRQAQAQFEILLAIEPTHPESRRYLALIEREKAYEKQLAAAQASWTRGDLLQAYTQAAAVADSVYTQDARELTVRIEAELDRRLALARDALEAGDAARALDLLRLIDAIQPGRADVATLLERARKPGPHHRRDTPPTEPPTPRRTTAAPGATVVQQALRLFLAGEIGPALARLRSAGAGGEALATAIQKFDQIYASAVAEHHAKRADVALPLLERAKALEDEISAGASSVFDGEIRRKLADMYSMRGVEAALAERWAEARSAFESALRNEPDHVSSRHELDELGRRAQVLLEEAETLMATDRVGAKDRYRLVLQLVPPSDGRYKRARVRLDAMP